MFVPNYFFAPSLLHRYSLCCSCRPRKSSSSSFLGHHLRFSCSAWFIHSKPEGTQEDALAPPGTGLN